MVMLSIFFTIASRQNVFPDSSFSSISGYKSKHSFVVKFKTAYFSCNSHSFREPRTGRGERKMANRLLFRDVRLTLSQLMSFKIRRTTFVNCIKLADLYI